MHLALVSATALCALPKNIRLSNGVEFPVVNLGGVSSRPSNYSAWLKLGGSGLDTALTYGTPTQESVGNAVRRSDLPRKDVFITTKIPCCPMFSAWHNSGCSGVTPANASAFIDQDLRELQVAEVDLLLLHWPCDTWEDTMQTYRAMEAAFTAGKARAIGISNFNASMVARMLRDATVKPTVNQCGYSIGGHAKAESIIGRDDATLQYCTEHKVAYAAYSPLGGLSKIDVLHNPVVLSVAKAHGVSAAQVALRWVAQQNVRPPPARPRRPPARLNPPSRRRW